MLHKCSHDLTHGQLWSTPSSTGSFHSRLPKQKYSTCDWGSGNQGVSMYFNSCSTHAVYIVTKFTIPVQVYTAHSSHCKHFLFKIPCCTVSLWCESCDEEQESVYRCTATVCHVCIRVACKEGVFLLRNPFCSSMSLSCEYLVIGHMILTNRYMWTH